MNPFGERSIFISLNMRIPLGLVGLVWKLYIAVIFTVTAILMYPLIVPFLTSTKQKKRAFRIFVFWSRLFRVLTFYPIKKIQREELPDSAVIILANHSSYLDIFLMYSILPDKPFLFLGKSDILKYPLIKTYFKRMNIPVFRGNRIKAARSLQQAAEEIKEGWSIVIFPEGGIPDHQQPALGPFKSGAFILAKKMEVPVVNLTFLNNYKLFSDPTLILGPAYPGLSKVIIHPTIAAEEVRQTDARELMNKCYGIINAPLTELRN